MARGSKKLWGGGAAGWYDTSSATLVKTHRVELLVVLVGKN